MERFAIGIPTLCRYDLLKGSLLKYFDDFSNEIYVVDNGKQGIDLKNEKLFLLEQEKNLGVAGSWNLLCDMIFESHEWALLLNDDIYCGYDTGVVNSVIGNSKIGFVQSNHVWSVILINRNFYRYVGRFDESFYPAYYEDSDYLYRMKLLGIKQQVTALLDPIVALRSMTYEFNPSLVNEAMERNRRKYIDKWGGLPLLEVYSTPYNIETKNPQVKTRGVMTNDSNLRART